MGPIDLHVWVREQLIGVLQEVQELSCREVPELSGDTVPLNDIPGFDSLCGVEAIVILEERLGIHLEDVVFVAPGTYQPLSVDELVTHIVATSSVELASRQDAGGTITEGGA